jgi:hypothetical protein
MNFIKNYILLTLILLNDFRNHLNLLRKKLISQSSLSKEIIRNYLNHFKPKLTINDKIRL